tara:strand:+ start:4478 stop:4981 length:504 start_codon:yes stop_codon:yes gene_type:complete
MLDESSLCVNKLNTPWTLWIHLPHDTNWDINSYKKICTFNYLEQACGLLNYIQENLVVNCMLFIMRDDIKPIWEDEKNKNGGCYSYKINNKAVYNIWKTMTLLMVSEYILNEPDVQKNINGITVSPKKNFCIIKLWFNSGVTKTTNITINKNIKELENYEGIYKQHI